MLRALGFVLVGVAAFSAAPSLAADGDDLHLSAERAVERGLEYLAQKQGADGGWHSQTYGQLKAGPGVTALVLYSFSRCPDKLRTAHPQLATCGYAYFTPGLKKRSTLAASDGSLDYPTYACALWLSGRARLSLPAPEDEQKQVVDYLLTAQLLEPRGFERAHPAYGGWDFLGADDARGITTGTNISLAAYILEALVGSDPADRRIQAAREHALAWALRTQQPDGGFAFTPEPRSLNNKALFADEDGDRPRSYGTATADGVRALSAAGMKADDERFQNAVKWLVAQPALDVVPGFEELPPEAGWQRGLRFYYYASLSVAIQYLPQGDCATRRNALMETLVKQQRSDGSWINESARMREDDPLIATSFAIAALGTLLDESSIQSNNDE